MYVSPTQGQMDVDSKFMIIWKKFISTRFRNEFSISIGFSITPTIQTERVFSVLKGNYVL